MTDRHIRHTHGDHNGTAWCGQKVTQLDWVFQDLDHAAYANMQQSSVTPCRKCIDAADDRRPAACTRTGGIRWLTI